MRSGRPGCAGARARCALAAALCVLAPFVPAGDAPRAPVAAQPRPPVETHVGGPALRVVATAPTGVQPKSVAVSPDGSRLYVCNFGVPDRDNVTVHDAATLAQIGVIQFPGNAVEAIFTRDGDTLFVSNFRRGVIEVIDPVAFEVTSEIAVGSNPKMMAVSPDGRLLYVANWSDQSVSVVDIARREVLRQLPVGRHPRGMQVYPDGRLLVASFADNLLHEFAPGGERELRRIETGVPCRLPRHLAMGPDPRLLYIVCTLPGVVAWYDTETLEQLGQAWTGRNPRSLGISPDGRFLATANFHAGDVTLAEPAALTHRVVRVDGAEQLVGLAVHPGSPLRIYVTSWTQNEVYALEVAGP